MGKLPKLFARKQRSVSEREGIIGASDVGALLGLSTYRTPYDVWLSWKGMAPEPDAETQERFDMGHELEDFIARQTERIYGVRLRRDSSAHFRKDAPWLICHPDRMATLPDGRKLAVEIKSSSVYTNARWGEPESDEVPYDYLCQCFMYWHTGVTDEEEMWLIRFSDNRLSRYVIRRDDALIKRIADEASSVVDGWMRGEEPLPSTFAQAAALFPDADAEESVIADFSAIAECEKYRTLKQQKKDIEMAIDESKAAILCYMGGAGGLVDGSGKRLVSYKKQTRSSIDEKLLREKYPEIAEEVTKTRAFMVLR